MSRRHSITRGSTARVNSSSFAGSMAAAPAGPAMRPTSVHARIDTFRVMRLRLLQPSCRRIVAAIEAGPKFAAACFHASRRHDLVLLADERRREALPDGEACL